MAKILTLHAVLGGMAIAVIATACGNTSTIKTEKVVGTEWNVTVCKAVPFHDTLTGINTDATYNVTDTAAVNERLRERIPDNLTLGWSIPSSDGTIWLVAYDNEPILYERVAVTEANSIPSYGGDIQVAFKFADTKKWETVTRENIGKRLAVFVNGQLMNAPQVNMEITSGNCAVSIPADKIHDYLPDFDLVELKQ